MKNIKIEKEGNTLALTVDLSKSQGPSKSGKSIVIATTGGNKEIAPGIYMGLNIYRKAQPASIPVLPRGVQRQTQN